MPLINIDLGPLLHTLIFLFLLYIFALSLLLSSYFYLFISVICLSLNHKSLYTILLHPMADSVRWELGRSLVWPIRGAGDLLIALHPSDLCVCVCWHVFRKDARLLFFPLQSMSDRMETESEGSPLVHALESGAVHVTKGDWRSHIEPALAADLRSRRAYNGRSVRTLVRALRNKVRTWGM